jgi:hypothetical protein
MKWRILTILGSIALACAIVAGVLLAGELFRRRGTPIPGLKNPEVLVLYSLDGTGDWQAKHDDALAMGGDVFQNYAVLGKLEIDDPEQRAEIVAALQNAVVWHDGMVASCFQPRHAIAAQENGKKIEVVICFECRSYKLDAEDGLISRRAEPLFNRILRDAGIPIAP